MDITRRSFLGGLLTVVAVSVAPRGAADAGIPRIVGDGIHDDGPGILAAINGNPFSADALVVRGQSEVVFGAGTFRMTSAFRPTTNGIVIRAAPDHATKIIGDHDDALFRVPPFLKDTSVMGFYGEFAKGRSGTGIVYE